MSACSTDFLPLLVLGSTKIGFPVTLNLAIFGNRPFVLYTLSKKCKLQLIFQFEIHFSLK